MTPISAGFFRPMAAAFRKAAAVEYHLLPPAGDDGHFLIYDKPAAAGWAAWSTPFSVVMGQHAKLS